MNLTETRTEISPPAEKRLAPTVGYYAAFIALGLTSASLGPTLPGLAEQTATGLSQISILFTARSVGYLLGSLLGGRLYDLLPGHPTMALMLALMVAAMATVPLIPLLWLLVAALLVIGIAEGAVDVGGNTLLVWLHRHNVGPFMNGLHFFFGVGAFLAPIIIAQVLLYSEGIAWAYWILALLMSPVIFWMAAQPSPAIQKAAPDDPVEQTNRLLVLPIALSFFLYVGAEVSTGGWIFTYATALNLAEPASAAYLTSAFWGALTVGRLLAIPIAARLRPSLILLIDLLGCLASVGLMIIWPGSITVVWIGTLGLGLFMASIFPTTLSFAERRMQLTGTITSLFFVGASFGAMSWPWLVGQLFEPWGPSVVLWLVLLALLIALLNFAVLMHYSSRRPERGHAL